jgi:RHS repeat-associated protein
MNLVGIEMQGRPDHKFQYNGKEKQEELGLHWNDYGARFYDPALGRWHSVDPMTESQERWSPYHYVYANPVLRTDPDGRCPDGDCPEISVAGILENTVKDVAVSVGNVFLMGSGPGTNANRLSRDENGSIQLGFRGYGTSTKEALSFIGADLLDVANVAATFGTGGAGGAGLLMAKTGAKAIITNAVVQEAKSSANGVKLGKQLASEAQMAEAGNPIRGHTPQKPLRIASEMAAKHGGDSKDYVKKSSSSYTSGQGLPFETHWEENLKTGQRFNEKTKLIPDNIPIPFKPGWRYQQKLDKIKYP